jgi:hypothetical protein
MKLIDKILNSFSCNKEKDFSARKLTAFSIMTLIAYCHFRYVDSTVIVQVLVIDTIFVLLLLSIITFEQVIRLKNGNTNNNDKQGDEI